jgi:hypothetical protein
MTAQIDGVINYAGLDEALSEEYEGQKRRFKIPRRQVDWAALISELMSAGMNYQEMAEMTGFSNTHLKAVKNERQSNEYADKAMRLLGLYTMNIGHDVPLLGDHHESVKMKDDF